MAMLAASRNTMKSVVKKMQGLAMAKGKLLALLVAQLEHNVVWQFCTVLNKKHCCGHIFIEVIERVHPDTDSQTG